MTARRDPDRLIDAFLQEGADQLHDQVYDAVRSSIEHRRQRVVLGPWRMPTLNKLVPIVIGAVAVVAVLFIGARLLPGAPAGTVGGAPTPSPTVTPSAAPTVAPTATPAPPSPTAPALTGTFTSARNGFSVSYPSGWTTRPATEPWTSGVPDFMSNAGDVLYDPKYNESLWIAIASQPLAGKAGPNWANDLVAQIMANNDCGAPLRDVTVDGAQGRMCGSQVVAVPSGDRGYVVWLYTSGDVPGADATFDEAWYRQFLATVKLHPGDAVDTAASAAP